MIIFFARYPSDDFLNDGMYRRVKEIDSFFEDKERLYVFPERNTGSDYRIPPLQHIGQKVASQALDFRYAAHNLHFGQLVAEADMIYAHTIWLAAPYIVPYLETGKVICDAHGVVSEEWIMSGYPSCSRFWNPLEERIVRDSARIVVVTRAMEDFYRKKYNIAHSRFIHIPIFAHQNKNVSPVRASDRPPRVIYAGGTHPWQNVDLMLDAARDFPSDAEFIFLSGDKDTFKQKIAERSIPHKVTLRSVPANEVESWYEDADFGFILRDDDPVNNVAFPTKLIEYMNSGVVPIIKTDHLGDIIRYGLESVTLEEFLRGELPEQEQRLRMAQKNLSIISTIANEYRQGKAALLSVAKELSAREKTPLLSTQFPTLIRNSVFPMFFSCAYIADGIKYSRQLDCAEYPLKVTLELPAPTKLSMLAFDISGREFVFAKPEAVFVSKDKEICNPCANASDFSLTSWGDIVYKNGWIYFTCPEVPVTRVTVRFDIKLFEMETYSLTAPVNTKRRLLKKAWRVLRQEGPLVFCLKVVRKMRSEAVNRLTYSGERPSMMLTNALKKYMPAPMKRYLKGLRSRAQQRRFIRKIPKKNNDIGSVDVLFQVDNFLAGGLENVVLGMIGAFREGGMRVALVVLGQPGEAVIHAEKLGFPVFIESYSDKNYTKLLDKLKPSLLLTHYSNLGLDLAYQRGIPVVQVIHNSYVWFSEQQRSDFRKSAASTDLFIAVSRWVADYSIKCLGIPSEKVSVIRNGIDLQKFQRPGLAEEGKHLRAKLGFTGTDVVFISVASIALQKNPLGLVRAFHAAMASCPNAKLAMLGPIYDPTLFQVVMQYCTEHGLQDKVLYLGTASDPAPYYAMADIFVHAAFYEGGSLSHLEVLAVNLPCVSTAVGDYVNCEDQPGIYLCPPPVGLIAYKGSVTDLSPTDKSVKDLSDCMCKAYFERKRPSLSEQELQMLDKKFSYNSYMEVISSLIKNARLKDK